MIKGSEKFNFIDKRTGVNKDGEQYLSINVLSDDNRKFNFITKDSKLIDKIAPLTIQKFAPIKLLFDIDRVFNAETRFSHWAVVLTGVE